MKQENSSVLGVIAIWAWKLNTQHYSAADSISLLSYKGNRQREAAIKISHLTESCVRVLDRNTHLFLLR